MLNYQRVYFQTRPYLVGGIPTPLKNNGVNVSWDDEDLPTEWKVIIQKVPVTTTQV